MKKSDRKIRCLTKNIAISTTFILLTAFSLLVTNSVFAKDIGAKKIEITENSNFFNHNESEAIAEVSTNNGSV